jgi:WD40 repeat protein
MRSAVVLLALVLAFLPLATSDPIAAPNFSTWGTPANLGAVVNSPLVDGGPSISKNGQSLFFHSNRPGGMGDTDIWVSQRASIDDPWGPPVKLGATINTSLAETVPTFSRDQHWMFFASTRPDGRGGNDIWASWRQHTHDDFGWQPPMNLGPNINTAFFDAGPAFFEGDGIFPPLLFFTTNKPGGFGGNDVYASELLPDGSFGPATHISELNSPANDARPTIRHDGLEIVLFSNRAGSFGGQDFWVSTRASLGSAWTLPDNLGPIINTTADEFQPQLSSDSKTLLFASNRPGGFGDFDLYMTVRSK